MSQYLFFDNASTTPCCEAATALLKKFAQDDFGNPSSAHCFGQTAAWAIAEARGFFADHFGVKPGQVIFTGSGTESDNLAVYGVALDGVAKGKRVRVLASAIEHPAVRKTVQSLSTLGVDAQLIPVDSKGQIQLEAYEDLLTPETQLISIQQVNNIVGSHLPIEELARIAKTKIPNVIFHSDCVQSFGRVDTPKSGSPIDLISISGHKVHGPKGVGALIVLNESLLKDGLRPLVWGGEQEGGLRSGTQNAGLIAGFKAAAEQTLHDRARYTEHVLMLRQRLKEGLEQKKLPVVWNSPESGNVPHIVSLSVPGYPGGILAKLLEDRKCLVSTGSACSSGKPEPDPVLTAMGLPMANRASALRISFSMHNQLEDVDTLVDSLEDSIRQVDSLMKPS